MIDLSKIKTNAESISEKGLDKKVLADAKKIFDSAQEKANFISRGDTHVKPETIAHYMQLFGGNLKGLKTLDLGCGMYRYSPLLPFAFKELGADVYAIDIVRSSEKLKEQGINYNGFNLNSSYLFEMYDEFFKGNDIFVARSFLDGGFYEDDDKISMKSGTESELGKYKTIINHEKFTNNQPFLAELDVPGEFLWKNNIDGNDNIRNFLEEFFRGKIICGFKGYVSENGESIYPKPFFLFE